MSKITYDGVEVSIDQAKALERWEIGKIRSARGMVSSVAFLRGLECKGFLKDVSPPTDEDILDPRAHYQFERVEVSVHTDEEIARVQKLLDEENK